MIDGYVRYSSPRITGNHGLAAVCFAVNDFPFMTLKAHQCVSFDEIQRFDHRQNIANGNPMQITPAFPWKIVPHIRLGFLLLAKCPRYVHVRMKENKIVVHSPV